MSEWHHRPSQHLHSIPVHRAGRQVTRRQVVAVVALTLAIVAVVVATIWWSGPARSFAPVDVTRSAAVPTTTPGTPIPRKAAEKSPPVPVTMPTDGTYLVGKTIKPGTYTSPGADIGRCYWARLKNTSGDVSAVVAASYHPGRQVVTVGRRDVAFITDGCGPWELMKP